MSTLSRRGLFAMIAAPLAALTGPAEVAAAVKPSHGLTSKPAARHAHITPVATLAPLPHRITPLKITGASGTLQAQISALQSAVAAMQTNEGNLWTFAVNTFAFANSVRGFANTTNDSLNAHYHYSEIQGGGWILTSGPQW